MAQFTAISNLIHQGKAFKAGEVLEVAENQVEQLLARKLIAELGSAEANDASAPKSQPAQQAQTPAQAPVSQPLVNLEAQAQANMAKDAAKLEQLAKEPGKPITVSQQN